jgi:hypothetical protein
LNNIEVVQDSDSFMLLVAPIKVQSSAWNSGTSCLLNITLCVCVKQVVSVFVLCLYTRHKQSTWCQPAKNQLRRLQWQFIFALDNGMNLLSLALDKREIVTHFRVQTYFTVGYQISINFKMAKYIIIQAFRRQSTYIFILSDCREIVCISCFETDLQTTIKLQWNYDMAFLNASVICDLQESLNVISNCYNPTP